MTISVQNSTNATWLKPHTFNYSLRLAQWYGSTIVNGNRTLLVFYKKKLRKVLVWFNIDPQECGSITKHAVVYMMM